MNIIVISDIHLGIDDKISETVKNKPLLISFLKKIQNEKLADEVVINGDFLDQWFLPGDFETNPNSDPIVLEENKTTTDNNDDKYEKICYICRRPESKTGKMISLAGSMNVCPDCMQRTFDSMGSLDLSDMSKFPNMPFNFMDMVGKLSDKLPLFIINGGICNENAWNGECNQLDVFTTILDILGIESQWCGLGHTLLNKNYKNSVTQKKQMVSEWIINGDFFGGGAQ